MNRRNFLKSLTAFGLIPKKGISEELGEDTSNKTRLNKVKQLIGKENLTILNEGQLEFENNHLAIFMEDFHGRDTDKEITLISTLINFDIVDYLFFEGLIDSKKNSFGFSRVFAGEREVVSHFSKKNPTITKGLENVEEILVTLCLLNYRDYKKREIATRWVNLEDEELINIEPKSPSEIYYLNSLNLTPKSNKESYINTLRNAVNRDVQKEFIDYMDFLSKGFPKIQDPDYIINLVEKFFINNNFGIPLDSDNWDKLILERRNLIGVDKIVNFIKNNDINSFFCLYGKTHLDTSQEFSKSIHPFNFLNAVQIIFERFFEKEFGYKPTIIIIGHS